MANAFSWLWKDEELEVEPELKVPEGGSFVNGFAGQWTIAPMWKFWIGEEIDLDEYGVEPDAKQKLNNGTNIYWRPENHEAAVAAGKAVGQKYGPKAVLRWEMPTTTMLNFGGTSAQETFGDTIAFDSPMTSMFGDNRHEYQMLFLPSLVQEMAMTSGIIKERVYEYDGLTSDNDLVNAEYQKRMIGEDKNYEESELWQARVKLWQELGENDAKKYTVNQKGKTDTDSKLLGGCISITVRRQTQLWARVARVANPRVPKEGKQGFGIWVVARIWPTKDAAVAEMGPEKQEGDTEYPNLPEGWEGASANDWIDWIKGQFEKELSKPRPALEAAIKKQDKTLKEQFACSAEDVIRWLDYLN